MLGLGGGSGFTVVEFNFFNTGRTLGLGIGLGVFVDGSGGGLGLNSALVCGGPRVRCILAKMPRDLGPA